ncbi:hypothetical protein TVAGG3_0260170 [Trichomonas vaginalis G3]|nr:hypothetical protein TVAGG3_0260170 [Trichomonas vaginalis G3]KAI5525060.1 hypothetical protein TVAGG3_0260170 [Trichomonas vaginalis G3]
MNITDFQNESHLYVYSDIKATFVTDFIFAALFIIFGIIYLLFTIRQTCEEKGEVEGQFEAQISYITAVFCKGLGLFITGLFLAIRTPKPGNHDFWDRYSVLPGGIPGYVTAIAYCFIFFSWCSVCFDSLEKDSVKFYSRSKWVLMTLISLVCVFFTISIICMLTINPETFHKVEATIAILRDLIIFFLFSLYLRRIFKLFEEPCPGWSSPETKLLFICITLIVSLIIRPISIGIYTLWIYPPNHDKRSEFATTYLIIYLIEILITEIVPIGSIGITRLTGSMQKTAKSEDVAQFLAIS